MEEIIRNEGVANANAENLEKRDLIINMEMGKHFLTYAFWGKFFGVLSYVGAGFMFIFSLLYLFIPNFTSSLNSFYGEHAGVLSFLLFLFCAILYFVFGWLLMKSSKSTKIGIKENNQIQIQEGTKNLALLMKFMGIATVIGFFLYVIIVIIMIVNGVNTAVENINY